MISYFLFAYSGIISFIEKRGKAVFLFCFLVAWSLYALNSMNPDYIAYRNEYYNPSGMFTEPLYLFISGLANRLGFSYRTFLSVVSAIGIGLVAKTILSFSAYPNPVFFLYMVYPFCMDVVHVRSFLAQACLMNAIINIVKYYEKQNSGLIIKGLLSLLIGIGFHYSAVLYLPLFLLFFSPHKHRKFFYVIIPLLYLLFPLSIKTLFPIISKIIGFNKAYLWIAGTKMPTLMHLVRLVVVRWALFLVILLAKYSTDTSRPIGNNIADDVNDDRRVLETQNEVLLLIFVYITLNFIFELFLHTTYERISRPALIVGNILLSRYIFNMEKQNAKLFWAFGVLSVVMYFASAMFFTRVVNQTWFVGIFRTILENNYLW